MRYHHTMKSFKLFLLFACVNAAAYSQDFSLFTKQLFINKSDTMPYRIMVPDDYDPEKKYALVIFLHGSGERGNDNEKQLIHGAELFLRDSIRKKYPSIVVFPQCSVNSYWSNVNIVTGAQSGSRTFNFHTENKPTVAMGLLLYLVNDLQRKYSIQKKKIYISGLSMGGMGTFEMVRRKPNLFAAAMPICGGANPATANKLLKTNWWIFHGEKDDIVNPQYSKDMAMAILNEGGIAKLTVYPNANHNSWDSAFAESNFMQWMFSNNK